MAITKSGNWAIPAVAGAVLGATRTLAVPKEERGNLHDVLLDSYGDPTFEKRHKISPILMNALYGAGSGIIGYGLGGAIGKQFGAENLGRLVGTANLATRGTDDLSMTGLEELRKAKRSGVTKSATEFLQKEAFVGAAIKGFGKSLAAGVKALKPVGEAVSTAAVRSKGTAQTMGQTGMRMLNAGKGAIKGLDPAAQQGLRTLGMTAGAGVMGLGGYGLGRSTLPQAPQPAGAMPPAMGTLPRPRMYMM